MLCFVKGMEMPVLTQKPLGANRNGNGPETPEVSATVIGLSKSSVCTVLQTSCVYFQGTGGPTEAILMFDTGSWKERFGATRLLNNEKLARHRLDSLSCRLDHDPDVKHRYNEALREMEANDIIKEVPRLKGMLYMLCITCLIAL